MHASPSPPGRLTDSPWFWAAVFSTMALVAVGLVAPKYARRQAQVESRFLGREQAAIERERRSAGLPPRDLASEAGLPEDVRRGPIVPLWTLAALAAAATAGSAVMLWRERRFLSGRQRV